MESSFKNGKWAWDEFTDFLIYMQNEQKNLKQISRTNKFSSDISGGSEVVRFKEAVDSLEQARFRKLFQRKVKLFEVEVITIQDIKDVALFTINPRDLSPEFIDILHTATMDRFLRALIVYFQFLVQNFEEMQERRVLIARTLKCEASENNERILRETFSELRSIISKEYAAILMGTGENKKFHHMNTKNNTSLSGEDKRKMEFLFVITVKIIWIAMERKYLSTIEVELNRLLRSPYFNNAKRKYKESPMEPAEKKIIYGDVWTEERKLKQRSPLIQEILLNDYQDFHLLSIGLFNLENDNERVAYLQLALCLPEEDLHDYDIGIGILGWPRHILDPMLVQIPKAQQTQMSGILGAPSVMSVTDFPKFNIPKKVKVEGEEEITKYYAKKLEKYVPSAKKRQERITQQKLWKKYLKTFGS